MIKKEELVENNINFIDGEKILKEEKDDKIEKIKEILPDAINSDNILNIEVLQDLLDITKTTANNQGYELKFAGKGFAKAKVDQPTTKELKAEIKQSKNFDTTENVIIRGDNIDALKILKQNYHGKIKMIYIDPPYNTGSDEFLYSDDFKTTEKELIEELGLEEDTINYLQNIYGTNKHSAWLSFMYPRLKLARELLTKDGVIFISINDSEQANLKLLCDEIFMNEFIAQIVWENKEGGGSSDSTFFKIKHEYILCYAKDKNKTVIDGIKTEEDSSYNYEDEFIEERGKYKLIKLNSFSIQYSASLDYPITAPNGVQVFPSEDGKIGCWRWCKEKYEWGLKNGFIEFKEDDGKTIVYTKQYFKVDNENNKIVRKLPPSALIEKYSSTMASKQLEKIFGIKKVFKYSKPYLLVKDLLKISTKYTNSDIILDFFAGSGTTAHAVMDLNKEDNGNRKFILVQLDEIVKNEKKSINSYNFIMNNKLIDKRKGEEPYISDITIERVNRSGENIRKELEEMNNSGEEKRNIDIGYKVFSLVNKPKIEYENDQFELFNKREKVIDILYNMMSVNDVELSARIEEIEKDKLYLIDDCYYIVAKCNQNLIDKKKQVYVDGYCNDIDLAFMLNLKETFKNDNIKVVY